MGTLFIPTKNDFKNWIREAVKESLNVSIAQNGKVADATQEPLINRKDISSFLGISWLKELKGMNSISQQALAKLLTIDSAPKMKYRNCLLRRCRKMFFCNQ